MAPRIVLVTKVVVMVLSLEMFKFVAVVVALGVAAVVVLPAAAIVVHDCRSVHCKRQCYSNDQAVHRVVP
jgi:hypothetical protein